MFGASFKEVKAAGEEKTSDSTLVSASHTGTGSSLFFDSDSFLSDSFLAAILNNEAHKTLDHEALCTLNQELKEAKQHLSQHTHAHSLERSLLEEGFPIWVVYAVVAEFYSNRALDLEAMKFYCIAQSIFKDVFISHDSKFNYCEEELFAVHCRLKQTSTYDVTHPSFWKTNDIFNHSHSSEEQLESKEDNRLRNKMRFSKSFYKKPNNIPQWKLEQLEPGELVRIYQALTLNVGIGNQELIDSTNAIKFFMYKPAISEYKQFFDDDRGFLLNEHQSAPSSIIVNIFINYLHSNNIIAKNITVNSSNILTGNGVLDMLGRFLIKLAHSHKSTVGKNVLLLPSPSYAFILDIVEQSGFNVVAVPMRRKDNYKLTPEAFKKAIEEQNEKLFQENIEEFKLAFRKFREKLQAKKHWVDIINLAAAEKIPLNDLFNFIDNKASLPKEHLYSILQALSDCCSQIFNKKVIYAPHLLAHHYSSPESLPFPPRFPKVCALYFANLHNPTGYVYSQEEIDLLDNIRRNADIAVIEDLNHKDFNFNKEKN